MKFTNPKAQQRFVEMKTSMLIHTPFFASLLMDLMEMRITKDPKIPTAGTNGKIIWFNEDFLAGLDLAEAVFVCCHEVSHAMWHHMERGRKYMDTGFDGEKFNPMLYNMAADYVINDLLIKSQIGRMPKIGFHDKQYTGAMLVDDVYRDLLKNAKQQPKPGQGQPSPKGKGEDEGEGSGDGDGDEESKGQTGPDGQGRDGGGGSMDKHIYDTADISEAEMKRAIASAVQAAKAQGKMPAELERWVTEVLKPQINWKEKLRHLVTRAASRDSTTWASPHRRRLVDQNIYLPKYTGIGAGPMVGAVDTSGSMGTKEFDAAWAEFADIVQTCNPESLTLMACDAMVHNVHEILPGECIYDMRPEMKGGGGTSFIPVFEKVDEMALDPLVAVYFTDGYGSFPDTPPPYPVIWVMTTDQQPPFGDTVKVELRDYE